MVLLLLSHQYLELVGCTADIVTSLAKDVGSVVSDHVGCVVACHVRDVLRVLSVQLHVLQRSQHVTLVLELTN